MTKRIGLALAFLLLSFSAQAGVVTAGVGHTQLPGAPAAGVSVVSGAANTYTTTPIVIAASTGAIYVTGIHVETSAALAATYITAQLMVGANGAETAIGQYLVPLTTASTVALGFRPIFPPIPMANLSRLTVKMADSVGSKTYLVSVETITQTNVVDDGIAQSANVTKWSGTAVASPATGGIPEVNVKNINNTAAATPGASGGVLISGTNSGTTTLGALTITGATTYTGNVALADGLTIAAPSTANRAGITVTGNGSGAGVSLTGGAASGATAAGPGFTTTGGAASTTGGGVSGAGLVATGGAGAASTNGAAAGLTATAGGTTTVSGNDGAIITGTSNGNALTLTHAGTGKDFNATTTPLTLAKTTNLTGLNDIAATAIVSSGAITTSSGAVTTVTTVTNQLTAAQVATGVWQDATAGDFTAAGSIGKSVMNGVALGTGLTVNDLTTKTGFSLAANQHVIVDSGTVTTLTNLPSIPANWLTAAGINAGALNGKGDWLLASSYTAPTNLTAAQIATGVWQDTTAGDFTTALSVGKSIMNGVSLGTGLTVASVSGSVGSVTGLTASNLDTTVSSRMATYTQPTGFLAATFPSGTVANTTNITAGTITTATNLTTNNDKTGYALTAAYDAAKTAASVSGVWSEPLAGYTTAGTAGKTLSGAGSAGDPWSTALPGSYGAGTAGFIVGTNLNATVSSIKGKTDGLTFTVPGSLDVNAHHINDVRLLGTGVPADPWRPQ